MGCTDSTVGAAHARQPEPWSVRAGIRQFLIEEDGVTAIEYALMGSLIALVIVVGVNATGVSVAAMFNRVAACVGLAIAGQTC